MLIIKQCFKFLNTFSFCFKQKVMLLSRQAHQITRAIICLSAIEVMHYPALGQWFAVSGFPDKDMFKDIALFSSSGMFWFKDKDISPRTLKFTTFPRWAIPSALCFQFLNVSLLSTRATTHSPLRYFHATIQAIFRFNPRWLADAEAPSLPGQGRTTRFASLNSKITELATVYARMLMSFPIAFNIFRKHAHTYNIPYYNEECNL